MLDQMKAAIGASAVAGLFGVAGLVGAAAPAGYTATMEANPSTAAQGGTVEISSVTPCPELFTKTSGVANGIDGSAFVVPTGEDGHWSADIEIPVDQEPGVYIVEARCETDMIDPLMAGFGAPTQGLEPLPYAPVTITVVAQETTTTSTTTSTSTTPTTAPPAASPAVLEPTYTG